MKKINKLCLILILSIFSVYIFYIVNTKSVKAYDSIDSTGATVWDKTSEEIVDKYGVHYSHMTGVPTTSGNKGSEKNVNYFSMKTDGENSKLVTWIKPMSNGSFGTSRLTSLAKDYEANNPGWIVVAGINADQWYYGTNKYSQKGGYFFFSNQTYYPLTVGGQNLFTISPLGISGNGIGITNDSTNPFIDASGSSNVLIKIYDDADTLIASYPVDGYNQTPSSNQTMVWSGRYSEEQLGNFIPREVSTTNDLYIVEYAELAYMNNSRDYAYEGTIYAPVDSFYGRGNISTIDKATTLKLGQFAIETTNEELKEVLDVGVKVIVEHQYAQESVNDLESVTGYHTNHVKNGQYLPLRDGDSYNSNTRPRSIFGIKEDGTYFLMTTRDALDTSLGGTTYTETNAILDYYDAYTAYQDDGGGSVTAIYRNNEGSFDVVSESCDPGVTERNICTGLFFVIRDPGYTTQFNNSTPTTIELNQKHTAFAKEMEDVQFIIENKTYDAQGDTTIIENLKENTEYEMHKRKHTMQD
ncbi:MAG: phosphodiester glycosidase family protein [Staphylococcus sp.]|nr:phosphodiester glycosidase family protein [Staphylococcus sp.]